MKHDRPLTYVDPATPPPSWCLPTPNRPGNLTEQFGGGTVCSGTRTFPEDNPHRRRTDPGRGRHQRWPGNAQRAADHDVEPPCTLDDIGAGSNPDRESLSPRVYHTATSTCH